MLQVLVWVRWLKGLSCCLSALIILILLHGRLRTRDIHVLIRDRLWSRRHAHTIVILSRPFRRDDRAYVEGLVLEGSLRIDAAIGHALLLLLGIVEGAKVEAVAVVHGGH